MAGIADTLRATIAVVIDEMRAQGREVETASRKLETVGSSVDALLELAASLPSLPYRADWPYREPTDLEEILKLCEGGSDASRRYPAPPPEEAAGRARAAFLGAVCGCVLGKPLEEAPYPDLAGIKRALVESGEWPMRDYVSVATLERHGRRNPCWVETCRENIRYVASDDDITYKILGMTLLEAKGSGFGYEDIRKAWIEHLPIYQTWGPERTLLLKAGFASLSPEEPFDQLAAAEILNPGIERCGAMIRVDAYGYACQGDPALAARLAWKDASWTHRKTGLYSAMFVAAAIAIAAKERDRMRIFAEALRFVPRTSRLYSQLRKAIGIVSEARDWESCNESIRVVFGDYGPCLVVQELAQVMNTLRFASDTGDGICKQVSQGNDTDSFGATAGSILGAYFGPAGLDPKWTKPFGDVIYTTMGSFHEHRLSAIADRMAALPGLIPAIQ